MKYVFYLTMMSALFLSFYSCDKQPTFPSPTQFGILDRMNDSKCEGLAPHRVETIDGFRKCSFFNFDKIRPIDNPGFVSTDSIDSVPDDWEVIGVFDGDYAKAYLLLEMQNRELVNDYFGDTPVAVVY